MSKENKVENKVEKENSGEKTYLLFFGLAGLMLVYLLYSGYNTYQTFLQYCESYNYNVSDQIGQGVSSILAAIIPCLVYACTLYGLGWIMKNKK